MRLKSILFSSTLVVLTSASSFPSGPIIGTSSGSNGRNDPDVEVLLNGVDTYPLRLIGGVGQISLTENPQLRRTSIGGDSSDGLNRSGNGRSGRINGLGRDDERFRIFRFGSIFRAGNKVRSGRKGGSDGGNREEDVNDDDKNANSSNEDDATSQNIADNDDDGSPPSPPPSVSLYPLATAEIVKGPQQLKCVITAPPSHQPWVLGVFTDIHPLRLISTPSSQASSTSPTNPPPATGASGLRCFISHQDVMYVLISLDISTDYGGISTPEPLTSLSAQASQITQLIPLSIFGRTQAQGVINMPISSSPFSSPNDDIAKNEIENEDEDGTPPASFPPQPILLLRTAAVIEGPPNLTCRIIYYSYGSSGPLQGQGFNLTKSLEMADTAIEGARYVYCDDVPMDEYVGDMPFMPS